MKRSIFLKMMTALVMIATLTAGFTACENPASGGSSDKTVSVKAVTGLTAPVTGAAPAAAVTETEQFTGTVAWEPAVETFAAETAYTATITLKAKEGFTFKGVAKDFFTVEGATATNAADSGTVTAVFPKTGKAAVFTAVTGITGVPGTVTVGKPLALTGTVEPAGATNKTITWSVKEAGETGAAISEGNQLTAQAVGTVTVTATIAKGKSETEDYTQDFAITAAAWVAVTGITGVPGTASVNTPLTLTGTVEPAGAASKVIAWSVKDPGETGAAISGGNQLTATAAGTVTVTATIAKGKSETEDYTQDFVITVEIVAVTGITGVPGTVTVGKPLTLTGTVEPEGATNRDIAWSVKDPGGTGAAISGGTLSVTATGTVKVTATIAKGKSETEDYTEDFEITAAAWVAVTGITGVPTTAYAKRPLTLSGTVAPAAATNKAITWSVKSAGGTGATVNGNTLTTTAAGTVTVTATITNGTNATTHYTQDFDITVQAVAVTGVSLDTATLTVGRGETATLAATIEPADATNKVVSWASGNEAVATVNNGVVTGVGVGTAVITVTTTDGGFTASCTVTVTEPAAGDLMTRTVNSNMTINFRYVPAGSFQRDATAANISIISKGYWLGETEVTQELFDAILPGNTYNFPDNPATDEIQTKRPAEMVNWYAAIAFCNKLSLADGKEPVYSVKVSNVEVDWTNLAYSAIPTSSNTNWNGATQDLTKNGYRLPTEMEWMWAAMGADKTEQPNTTGYQKKYAGSTESGTAIVNIGNYAWYISNSSSKTHEVGKKTANELNLYDMSGNLWEWCWDRHNSSIPAGEQIDYAGAASGTARVIKGGNWNLDASYCSLTTRSNPSHQSRASDIGFRVVCPAQ